MQIHLSDLKFRAYHGLQPGEEIIGSDYKINVTVTCAVPPQIDNITQTVDYTALYQFIRSQMAIRRSLIETVAMEIASEIIAKFSIIESVEISIFKLHPPIAQFEGSVGVTFKLNR